MMKPYQYILGVVLTALLASCSVTRNQTYSPSASQLNIQMSDLEYLGETEISVEYRTYMGLFRVIDRINDVPYDGVEIDHTTLESGSPAGIGLCGRLNRAAGKVFEQFPGADYFIVVSQSRHKTRLFLGAEVTEKAKVRAYAFK